MNPSLNRALIFQGGGSLGAYEAGAYKAVNEDSLAYFRTEGRDKEPLFHIVSGTSIGAINATLLVNYVKENKTWEGSGEKLVEFWEYLSTKSTCHTSKNIGILGAEWIEEVLQESLQEDILAPRNLFSRECLKYLYQRYLCMITDFMIHQIHGMSMTTNR